MNCELISVGTEILLGDIVNTDAQFLSRELAALGIDVLYTDVVGDNRERLTDTLRRALSRSDIVILSGGLGPTKDDLTKEVCCETMGVPLREDARALAWIEEYFRRRGTPMADINRKQALVPEGGVVFYNSRGTAPGCAVERDGKCVILLPGPAARAQSDVYRGCAPLSVGKNMRMGRSCPAPCAPLVLESRPWRRRCPICWIGRIRPWPRMRNRARRSCA
ncbi:MAG: molybdopterin-binding protein [Clostridia bacterium]